MGLLTFDGVSNVTTSLQANLDGTLTSLTGTGTYSVTGSGAGSMTLVLSNNVTLGFSLAVQSGGKQLQLILSSESDQVLVNELYGTAIYQSAT